MVAGLSHVIQGGQLSRLTARSILGQGRQLRFESIHRPRGFHTMTSSYLWFRRACPRVA